MTGIQNILSVAVLACVIVFGAMIIDLGCGLYKAHLRREVRRSEALKRSVNKFILYEGSLLIAVGIDSLIYYSHTFVLFGVDLLETVPAITIMLAIFLCCVEMLSIKEKADEKLHSEMSKVAKLADGIVSERVLKAFEDALIKRIAESQKNESK